MVIFYLRVAEDQGSERDWASNLQTCSIVLLYLDVNMQSTLVFKKRTCVQICFFVCFLSLILKWPLWNVIIILFENLNITPNFKKEINS